MPTQQFEGKSNDGNFQEALAQAIENAKQTLETDFVKWEIDKISGEDGGFVPIRILSVKIRASPYQGK